MTLDALLGMGQSTLELALINALVVLALFLSYSMLNVCDLSTDGCFTLGAVVGSVVALLGHPYLSLVAAMAAGIASGFVVAFLQTKIGINSLLAGIIVNTGLYSVNIAIMKGSSNVNLNKVDTVFTQARKLFMNPAKPGPITAPYKLMVMAVIVVIAAVVLLLFLRTRLGLAIRATGNNPAMVRSSSINTAFTTTVGLCFSNSFTALAGCLLAQYQKSAEVNIGSGMVTVALASLLIGTAFLGRGKMPLRIAGMVLGSFIFQLVYAIALQFHMKSYMLKLISAIVVTAAISIPYIKQQVPLYKRMLTAGKGGARRA